MGNDTPNEKNLEDWAWKTDRTSASKFSSSEYSMDMRRRAMIRKALDFEIIDIRSYLGYKGDFLVEFTTLDIDTVSSLKEIAESLKLEVTIKQDLLMIYCVYCIVPNEDLHKLKE